MWPFNKEKESIETNLIVHPGGPYRSTQIVLSDEVELSEEMKILNKLIDISEEHLDEFKPYIKDFGLNWKNFYLEIEVDSIFKNLSRITCQLNNEFTFKIEAAEIAKNIRYRFNKLLKTLYKRKHEKTLDKKRNNLQEFAKVLLNE